MFIKVNYEQEDNWMTKEVTTPYGVSLRRSIRAPWGALKDNSKIKVLDGKQTSFWKENRHEVGNLETVFSDIFNLVIHQRRTSAKIWTPQ